MQHADGEAHRPHLRPARAKGIGRNGRRARDRIQVADVVAAGRRLPRRLRREWRTSPETVAMTVSGASFAAGMLLGSGIGRALLLATATAGARRYVETELGPRVWEAIRSWIGGATRSNLGH